MVKLDAPRAARACGRILNFKYVREHVHTIKIDNFRVEMRSGRREKNHQIRVPTSPEQLLLSFRPRRLYDTIHDVSNLADSDVRRLIENRAEILNDMKLANYDARLEASSRLMSR